MCKSCKLIFRSRRPTQDEIQASYDSDETFSSWEEQYTERHTMWSRRVKLIQGFSTGSKLLDIGTGDGHFLDIARESGFCCEGTEFSNAGKSRAEKLGFKIHFGQLMELNLPADSFDIVTIWHVLEHVPNPGDILKDVFRILKPGGIIAVAVPNEENLLFRWRIRKTSVNPLGEHEWGKEIHLTHFQPQTLRRSIRRNGFGLTYFGVDDVYGNRNFRNMSVLNLHKIFSLLSGWHFSIAMICVAQKPVSRLGE